MLRADGSAIAVHLPLMNRLCTQVLCGVFRSSHNNNSSNNNSQ